MSFSDIVSPKRNKREYTKISIIPIGKKSHGELKAPPFLLQNVSETFAIKKTSYLDKLQF